MSLAVSSTGTVLLDFMRCDKPEVPETERDIPLTFTMVTIHYQGKYVFVHNMKRKQWETPGGGIEMGEALTDCARREVWEESSQIITEMTFIGFSKLRLDDGRVELGGVYRAELGELAPFRVNNEMDGFMLWDLQQDIGNVGVISLTLLKLACDL